METEAIIKKGTELFKEFVIDDDVKETYGLLDNYFRGVECDLDLEKGILLAGNIGTGKTIAMHVFGRLKGFQLVSTRHVVRDFANDGMDTLNKYGRESFLKGSRGLIDKLQPKTLCFDDLGLEDTNSQLYGNKANVMAEILIDRYEHWRFKGMITHATTNLNPTKIAEIYGDRVMDRINEMMNIVFMKGDSKRK